jgi:hypothetical protein
VVKSLYAYDSEKFMNWKWGVHEWTKPLYVDLVIRWGSFWVGAHYSDRFNSVCIALVPCIVVRIGRTKYTMDCKVN